MFNKLLSPYIFSLIALLFLILAPSTHAQIISLERIVGFNGNEANDGSGAWDVSADGRYVSLASFSTNLVPNDTNGQNDVFVYDRETGVTERVSIASDGTQGNAQSGGGAMSSDGRYIAFESNASNLILNDTNETADIFVHDRVTQTTERVSVATDGTQANNSSSDVSISTDGRYVAFTSYASNLVPGDTNAATDVFVHDRETGTTELVNVASDGTKGNDLANFPSLSSDGRHVAFLSYSTNLVPNDTNNLTDMFVHDRQTGETERVSIASDGTQMNNNLGIGYISANGEYVTFSSRATNLVPNDTSTREDIFVHNRVTGETERVSVSSAGAEADALSASPNISADGRYVSFYSHATNLVPGDTNVNTDVFVHDRQTGRTERISVAPNGTQGNNAASSLSFLSDDGQYVAFGSAASNLVPGDTNNRYDTFVATRDLTPNMPPTIGTITASVNPVQVNTATSVSASFTDPDASDTHTAVWDWGDGSTSAGSISGGTVTGTHSYTTAGVYTVGLTVTDSENETATATYQYLTVYTPVFGKASGSKEFISPAGAVVGNSGATGKADFGFQVDYHQGDTVPSGADVELSFPAGNIDYVSSAYEWVVINGTKATLKATGSLNGVAGYTVLVSAIDQGNTGGLIRFQIKNASGAVVYDTQPGAADTADPTLPVSKGKIKVQ